MDGTINVSGKPLAGASQTHENARKWLRQWNMLVVLAALVLGFGIAIPEFATPGNWLNIARQIAVLAMVAVGVTLVIIAGEIDLSVAGIVGLATTVTALTVRDEWPLVATALLCVALAIAFGLLNGFVSLHLRVPSFLATLAVSMVALGIGQLLTNRYILVRDPLLTAIGGQGTSLVILYVLAPVLLGYVLLQRTILGRHIYATGAGPKAEMAGIRTRRIKYITFVISASLAVLAGFLLAGRAGRGWPDAESGLAMDAMTVIALGGTRLGGGQGGVIQTFVGVLILGVILNAMSLVAVPIGYQWMVKGLILLIALLTRVR